MTVPHRIAVDFAKRKGKVEFPCFYCANKVVTNDCIVDEHNIIKEFGSDGGVPQTCMAGQRRPTGYADCKYALYVSLEHNRAFDNSIFDFLTREYMMEVLTTINALGNAPKSMIIERSRKGYHTREERIAELYEAHLIDMFYNIDNEETYILTARGKSLAEGITYILERFIEVKEVCDSLDLKEPRMVFEYIRQNSGCTKRQIYDHFGTDNHYDVIVPLIVEDLTRDGYIEPTFNEDYSEICFNTTYKGVLRWAREDREY